MIERILVATDFSTPAEVALRWGMALASKHDASLRVVHALRAPNVGSPYMGPPQRMVDELEKQVAGRLGELRKILETEGISCRTKARWGAPAEVVEKEAAECEADLVIVGAVGAGAVENLLLGSTAERLLPRCHCPVLTVHPDDDPTKVPQTVVVPTDFSEEVLAAAELAMELFPAEGSEARMVLAHVLHLPIEYAAYGEVTSSGDYLSEIGAAARAELDTWSVPLAGKGWRLEKVVSEGPPAAAVLRLIEEHAAGLVAMGNRGRSGLSSFLLGSNAKRIVQKASCPVLTVRRADD